MHMKLTQVALAIGLLCLTGVAFAALVDDVGDADSFGRSSKYLGAKSSPFIYLERDCAALGDIGTIDRCVTINPTGTTVTSQANMMVFKLPANSTRSLLCFSYNLYASYSFANNGGTRRQSTMSVRPTYTIENPILNGSSVIDPFTGAPANGKISSSLSSYLVSRSLSPGDSETQSQQFGRGCVGGLINKQLLQSAGLSNFQIALFFASPITLTIGSAGNVSGTERGGYQFGFRLYGD